MKENASIQDLEAAIKNFRQIPGWRDSDNMISICARKIADIKARQEAERLRQLQQEEAARIKAEKAAQKRKRTVAFVLPILIGCIAAVILYITVILPKQKIGKAMTLLDSGDYESAYALLAEIGKDDVIKSNKYDRAAERLAVGDYKSVYILLNNLHYKDSDEIITKKK